MGRTEPSLGRPPAGFRRDARAKRAKATVNKVIPSLLSAHPRARKGIESAELIVDPPPAARREDGKGAAAPRKGSSPGLEGSAGMRITMRVADTLTVAHSLLPPSTAAGEKREKPDLANREARVGILNMASPLSPGGGFLNGSAAQEESLCMRTTLLPSLRDEFYRLPELGAIYTPDVLVFRAEDGETDLPKKDRWFADCISAAMLRIPETHDVEGSSNDDDDGDGDNNEAGIPGRRKAYADPKDRELVLRKMRVVLRVAQAKGIRKLVLGAWGCGAYGNPVEEIAAAWRKVLLGGGRDGKTKNKKGGGKKEIWDGIEEVVFAIKGGGVAERFERAFGDGLVREEDTGSRESGEETGSRDGDDLEEARLRELRDKIQQLEVQVQQARSTQLKSGLSTVLAGLRNQLPEDGPSSSERVSSSRQNGVEDDEEDDDIDGTTSKVDREGSVQRSE